MYALVVRKRWHVRETMPTTVTFSQNQRFKTGNK